MDLSSFCIFFFISYKVSFTFIFHNKNIFLIYHANSIQSKISSRLTQVIIYKVFGWNLNVIKVFVRGIIRFARSTFEYRVWVILYFSTCISVCDRTSVLVGLFSIISKTRSRTAVYKIFTYSKIKKSNAFLTIYLYFSLSIISK